MSLFAIVHVVVWILVPCFYGCRRGWSHYGVAVVDASSSSLPCHRSPWRLESSSSCQGGDGDGGCSSCGGEDPGLFCWGGSARRERMTTSRGTGGVGGGGEEKKKGVDSQELVEGSEEPSSFSSASRFRRGWQRLMWNGVSYNHYYPSMTTSPREEEDDDRTNAESPPLFSSSLALVVSSSVVRGGQQIPRRRPPPPSPRSVAQYHSVQGDDKAQQTLSRPVACRFYLWNFPAFILHKWCHHLAKDCIYEGKGGVKVRRENRGDQSVGVFVVIFVVISISDCASSLR